MPMSTSAHAKFKWRCSITRLFVLAANDIDFFGTYCALVAHAMLLFMAHACVHARNAARAIHSIDIVELRAGVCRELHHWYLQRVWQLAVICAVRRGRLAVMVLRWHVRKWVAYQHC